MIRWADETLLPPRRGGCLAFDGGYGTTPGRGAPAGHPLGHRAGRLGRMAHHRDTADFRAGRHQRHRLAGRLELRTGSRRTGSRQRRPPRRAHRQSPQWKPSRPARDRRISSGADLKPARSGQYALGGAWPGWGMGRLESHLRNPGPVGQFAHGPARGTTDHPHGQQPGCRDAPHGRRRAHRLGRLVGIHRADRKVRHCSP
jgi:hypothetical protein